MELRDPDGAGKIHGDPLARTLEAGTTPGLHQGGDNGVFNGGTAPTLTPVPGPSSSTSPRWHQTCAAYRTASRPGSARSSPYRDVGHHPGDVMGTAWPRPPPHPIPLGTRTHLVAVSAQIRGSMGIAACGETGSGSAAGYRGHLEKIGGTWVGLRHLMGRPKQ